MSIKRIISGMDFVKALIDAGIVPPNTGDMIIEVKVGGPVVIHCVVFGDESLLKVIPSDVSQFHIEDVEGK